jgi:hypothetical protein
MLPLIFEQLKNHVQNSANFSEADNPFNKPFQSLYLEDYSLCKPMPQELINLVLEKRRNIEERRANIWLSYCFLFSDDYYRCSGNG